MTWGVQGELLVADNSATNSPRIATFQCDDSLRIASIDGTISELLECEPGELYEHMWHPFLDAHDWPVVERMAEALSARRGGQYDLCARSRSGARLYLSIATMVSLHSGKAGGAILLRRWETTRRHVDLGRRSGRSDRS